MELMKMRSFPTNVGLTILTEKLASRRMDGTQGNSGIGGVFVPVPHNVMETEKTTSGLKYSVHTDPIDKSCKSKRDCCHRRRYHTFCTSVSQ